jgi:RHS repeat-associated protein
MPKPTSKVEASQLSLPKGGGAIKGLGETFQANEFSGTAGLSIPIFASPCRDFTPALALSYSSGSGNGPWGLGFSLSVPQISRQTRRGTPTYQNTDIFVLSGAADLVPLDQAPRNETLEGISYTIQTFAPRQEGLFSLIEYWQPADPSQAFWKVTGTDHTISIFGKNTQAKIADPSNPAHIFTWLLEESYNPTGDHQLFRYKQENTDNVPTSIYEQNRVVAANRYIERIQYGNERPIADSLVLNPALDPGIWHFEVIFDYGEYNIDPSQSNPYQPVTSWACRPDPFSGYEAGFEIRTYRRCLHTLMFHRFAELGDNPVLVQAGTYNYQANAAQLSECISISTTGYSYDTEQEKYTTVSIPPLSLSYTSFQPEGHEFTLLTDEQGNGLQGLNEAPNYTLVDLYGAGIPGILYSENETTYYREPQPSNILLNVNQGIQPLSRNFNQFAATPMQYAGWQLLETFPNQRTVNAEGVSLQDLTGNGQLDIVLTDPTMAGYWEAQPDHSWANFCPIPSWPANFPAPNQTWVDVTGDGIPDLVQLTGEQILIYPNIRRQGLGAPLMQPKLPGMPVSLDSTPTELITFADMVGSGQAHLVRICSGEVVYWPNLSYGCFGAPIRMGNAPLFGPDFNTTQLFLADLDGSGAIDLIYIQPTQAFIYLNQSGNTFSDAIILRLPTLFDNLDQITFADIYGRGNECLVISELHANSNPRYWCYDFCQGQKPYLLYQTDNNLGASTKITYGSSVDFYLADKQAGLPWITSLPFPVQVITQVEHTDQISGSRYTSQYAYHHGYYDGVEREFRGFGRVDRQDAEYFPPDERDQDPDYAAPSLSRTWYHTGCYLENTALSRQYAKEYYAGDTQAFPFPDSYIDWNDTTPDGESIRQAYVAMAGTVLRSELYGLDDSSVASNPYTVSEGNFRVVLKQALGDHPYAIFYVHAEQSVSYDYERNPLDPQIQQSCVLLVDDYGNVEQSCTVAYPRRTVEGALPEQQITYLTCAIQSYSNQTDPTTYLLGVPIESQSYQLISPALVVGKMLSFDILSETVSNALATVSPTHPSSEEANLLSWGQVYYTQVGRDGTNTSLPLGQVTLPVLVANQFVAEFSQDQIANALQTTPLTGESLQQTLKNGYYQFDTTSNYWWNTGLTAIYGPLSQFYTPTATVDPAGNKTAYAYDSYQLMLSQVTDALDNIAQVKAIDYQHLIPMQLVDINGNISEIKLDPLGRVIYTSQYGHEAGNPVGFVPLSQAPTLVPDSLQTIIANPDQYLGNTQSYFYYDPFAWQNRQEPVVGLSLVAEQYPDSTIPNRIQIHLSYNDGLGRTLCSKAKVEPGEAFLYDPTKTPSISEGYTDNRWLTSGRVEYNNKGKPVKQYEPYFINTYDYVSNPVLNTFGVTPILYYDPLDRVTHTITAKGYLQKQEWTPWETLAHDGNDTFVDSPYCQVNVLQIDTTSLYYDASLTDADRQAINAAITDPDNPTKPSTALGQSLVYVVQYFHNTPRRSIIDNLGHEIRNERINKSQDTPEGEVLTNYYTYDILGRQLTSSDPRLSQSNMNNFVTTYSLTGASLQVVSADAGSRWALTNTLGNPIWSYDERQVTTIPSYDVLHRPTQIYVQKPATKEDPLVLDQVIEKMIYGDTPGAVTDPANYNLRGQIYQHYDQAGLVSIPSYSLLGLALSSARQFTIAYKQEPDWTDNDPQRLLQSTIYQESSVYDALGRVVQETDVDQNQTKPSYNLSGLLQQLTVIPAADQKPKQLIQSITYNATGQRLSSTYDNMTTTTYTYDPQTWALTRLYTVNSQSTVLQDLVYVYDPVGNVVSKTDNGQDTVYYANQAVNPTATYIYDSLYRLIQGGGREKIGSTETRSGRHIPLIRQAPHANDNSALQNYIEKYSYDNANNLIQTQHTANQDSWTRQMVVSNTSNRAVIATINGDNIPTPEEVNQYFDVHGNQIKTQAFYPLRWNYRDNLQKATVVQHADGTEDAEYYVYDGGGQRVRKVYEQYKNAETIIFQETLYLGVDCRRTLQGQTFEAATVQEEYHCWRVLDDRQCIATQDDWVVGTPPTEFSNPCWRYHLSDALGSCTVEVNDQGQQISYEEYTPFGATLLFIGTGSADQLKHYRYSGQERDSVTGFYYYGARYYAPWLTRWLSPDPANTINGLNLYAFVTDDPETYWDVGGMGKYKLKVENFTIEKRGDWGETLQVIADEGRAMNKIKVKYEMYPSGTVANYEFGLNANQGNVKDPEKLNYFHQDASDYDEIATALDAHVAGGTTTADKEQRKVHIARSIRRVLKGTAFKWGLPDMLTQAPSALNAVLKVGTLLATSESLRSENSTILLADTALSLIKKNPKNYKFSDVFSRKRKSWKRKKKPANEVEATAPLFPGSLIKEERGKISTIKTKDKISADTIPLSMGGAEVLRDYENNFNAAYFSYINSEVEKHWQSKRDNAPKNKQNKAARKVIKNRDSYVDHYFKRK